MDHEYDDYGYELEIEIGGIVLGLWRLLSSMWLLLWCPFCELSWAWLIDPNRDPRPLAFVSFVLTACAIFWWYREKRTRRTWEWFSTGTAAGMAIGALIVAFACNIGSPTVDIDDVLSTGFWLGGETGSVVTLIVMLYKEFNDAHGPIIDLSTWSIHRSQVGQFLD
jgi:hypothetical protein